MVQELPPVAFTKGPSVDLVGFIGSALAGNRIDYHVVVYFLECSLIRFVPRIGKKKKYGN
eukprot:2014969-Amphidinium_carterae.1